MKNAVHHMRSIQRKVIREARNQNNGSPHINGENLVVELEAPEKKVPNERRVLPRKAIH